MTVGHLQVGKDRFPVAVQGDGPPILFVHGAPGDWRTFAPHAALLADRYRCITYTQRWFGTAEWREDGPPFGTEAHAADLIALAEALDMSKLALVAWSYGAHPAMAAAIERPDLFSTLFVYEPGFGTFIRDAERWARYRSDADAAWVRAMWDASGGAGAFDDLPAGQQAMLRDSLPALHRLLDQTPPVPLGWDDLNRVKMPAVVSWGRQSRPCFTIPSAEAADCLNGSRFPIEGAGHLWPQQQPEGFTRVVDHWLGMLREEGRL